MEIRLRGLRIWRGSYPGKLVVCITSLAPVAPGHPGLLTLFTRELRNSIKSLKAAPQFPFEVAARFPRHKTRPLAFPDGGAFTSVSHSEWPGGGPASVAPDQCRSGRGAFRPPAGHWEHPSTGAVP